MKGSNEKWVAGIFKAELNQHDLLNNFIFYADTTYLFQEELLASMVSGKGSLAFASEEEKREFGEAKNAEVGFAKFMKIYLRDFDDDSIDHKKTSLNIGYNVSQYIALQNESWDLGLNISLSQRFFQDVYNSSQESLVKRKLNFREIFDKVYKSISWVDFVGQISFFDEVHTNSNNNHQGNYPDLLKVLTLLERCNVLPSVAGLNLYQIRELQEKVRDEMIPMRRELVNIRNEIELITRGESNEILLEKRALEIIDAKLIGSIQEARYSIESEIKEKYKRFIKGTAKVAILSGLGFIHPASFIAAGIEAVDMGIDVAKYRKPQLQPGIGRLAFQMETHLKKIQ